MQNSIFSVVYDRALGIMVVVVKLDRLFSATLIVYWKIRSVNQLKIARRYCEKECEESLTNSHNCSL